MNYYIQKDFQDDSILKIEYRHEADENTVGIGSKELMGKAFIVVNGVAVIDQPAQDAKDAADAAAKADREAAKLAKAALRDKIKANTNEKLNANEVKDLLLEIKEYLGL